MEWHSMENDVHVLTLIELHPVRRKNRTEGEKGYGGDCNISVVEIKRFLQYEN